MDQGPLHGLFVRVLGCVDRLHGPGIQARVVHHRGDRGGGGVEVLDLLGHVAHVPDVLGQGDGVLQPGARVGGHEIGHHVLIEMHLGAELLIFFHEALVDRVPGLAHEVQHMVADVLRGHPELARDVVFHQLPEEGVVLVRQQVVEADAAADEDLFHPGQGPELPQQLHVVRVIRPEIPAGPGEEALLPGADPLGELLFAGGEPEVGRGAAHVVDVALEFRVFGHAFSFPEDGLVAPGLDDAALVEGDGAEGAAAEAAPVGGQAELDLLDGRDAAELLVAGVVGILVGQVVGLVHLRLGQGLLGRVLDHELPAVGLDQGLGREGVRVQILGVEGPGVGGLVVPDGLPVREGDAVHHLLRGLRAVDGAVQEGQVLDREARVQGVGHLHDGALPHAVEQQVRLGVQ